MSNTVRKRLFYEGGHLVEGEDEERRVSHSRTCYLCGKGRKARRLLVTKPERRRQKAILRREVKEATES